MLYLALCSAEPARTERQKLIARTIAADGMDCLVLGIDCCKSLTGRWRNLMTIEDRDHSLHAQHSDRSVIEIPVYLPSGWSLVGLFDKGWRAVPERVARRFMGNVEPVTS